MTQLTSTLQNRSRLAPRPNNIPPIAPPSRHELATILDQYQDTHSRFIVSTAQLASPVAVYGQRHLFSPH